MMHFGISITTEQSFLGNYLLSDSLGERALRHSFSVRFVYLIWHVRSRFTRVATPTVHHSFTVSLISTVN